ncbi:MAG: hypothetical protein L6R38_001001 [Xanthoria sp. 2 TBL-2021]|nr:MAG: hypothetical protein L6R38_001001 [Xanthoria sp. 2 TBL-2021]
MPNGLIDLTTPSSSPPEDSPSLQALQVAIDEAQPERLRNALRSLCSNSKDTARAAQAILLVPVDRPRPKPTSAAEEEGEDTDENGEDTDQSESESSSKDEAAAAEETRNTVHGLKRLRPRYATCTNCEEEFDITQNESGDCVYHPEETEVDYDGDAWADHDEDWHGTIDSEEMRREFPEGFIYPCCDKNGESEGCKTSRHIEKIPYPSKKTRY